MNRDLGTLESWTWWFKKGSRTQIKVKIRRENFYLYSTINPKNGEDVSLLAPHVNTDCMNIFLEQISKDFGTRKAFLIIDCASWHKSKDLKIPENIIIIYLPPYSPLSSILWRDLGNI